MIPGEVRQLIDEREIGVGDERVRNVLVLVCQPGLHGGILQGSGSLTDWNRQQRLLRVQSLLCLIEDDKRGDSRPFKVRSSLPLAGSDAPALGGTVTAALIVQHSTDPIWIV